MKLVFALLSIVVLAGCVSDNQNDNNNSNSTMSECVVDSDCVITGCSAQLCAPSSQSDIITTCEYKSEYQCLEKTSCSCVQGNCDWENTVEYQSCLEQVEDIGPIV